MNRFFKKIISITAAAAVAFALMPAQLTYAAGLETSLAIIYLNASADATNSLQPNGLVYNAWHWQHYQDADARAEGLPNGGKVLKFSVNDPKMVDGSMCTDNMVLPDSPIGAGVCFRDASSWQVVPRDFSAYVDTAMVTAKVKLDNPALAGLVYLYLADNQTANNNDFNYVGVKLDTYTADDVGTWKTVNIPLSIFVNGGSGYTLCTKAMKGAERNFNAAKAAGGGLMIGPSADVQEQGFLYLDDFRICNVLPPSGLTVQESDAQSAVLVWNASDSNVTGYEVLRNGEVVGVTGADELTYVDTGLTEMTNYQYTVRAVDPYGAYSAKTKAVNVYTASIGNPHSLTATSSFGTELKVQLTWQTPAYGEPAQYNIYRNGQKIAVAAGDTLVCDDADGLEQDTYYDYYVTAVDADGVESMPSETVTILASLIGYPEELTATAEGRDITLAWSPVNGASAYRIICNGELLAEVDGTNTTYLHKECDYAVSYVYQIRAVSGNGLVSLASDWILIAIDHPSVVRGKALFTEGFGSGCTPAALGKTQFSVSDTTAAEGKNAIALTFAPGSNAAEGLQFTFSSVDNMAARRINGGAVELYLLAEDKDALEQVKLGLTCNTTFNKTTYPMRTSVQLSDYVQHYGIWNRIVIPLSDFPYTGRFTASGITMDAAFQFDAVTGLACYTDTPSYQMEKTVWLDDVHFSQYEQPRLISVELADGTEVKADALMSGLQESLILTFDTVLDAAFVNTDTIRLITDGKQKPIAVAVDDEIPAKVIIDFTDALVKNTAYQLVIDGVQSVEGMSVLQMQFGFLTNSDKKPTVEPPSGGSGGTGSGGIRGSGGGRSTATVSPGLNVIPSDPNASTQPEPTVPSVSPVFSDTGSVKWAEEAIGALYEKGYVTGYEDNTFRPENNVTREEFVTMLMRALQKEPLSEGCTFTDVAEDRWYYGYIAAAQADGVTNGSDGRFGIGQQITRQDMCAMLARAAEIYKINLKQTYETLVFADADTIADYAAEGIARLQAAGVINGVGDQRFDPLGDVNRAMAAKSIYELIQIGQ